MRESGWEWLQSRRGTRDRRTLHPTLPYPLPFYPVLSYPVLSYPILPYPFLSYLLVPYPVLSFPILSYPTVSCPVLLYPSYPVLCYLCYLFLRSHLGLPGVDLHHCDAHTVEQGCEISSLSRSREEHHHLGTGAGRSN